MPEPLQPVREWVPSCFLVLHGPQVHTSMRYCPMHIQRAADVTYRSRIQIFGRSPIQPVWSIESGVLHLDDVFSIESARVADEIGQGEFLYYGESYNWCPERPPGTADISMNTQIHYGSSDGSLHGHLASFYIFGAPRLLQRGHRYYENFPSARIGGDHALSVFTMNPFLRPTKCRVHIVDRVRGTWKSPEYTIRGKAGYRWSSRDSGYEGSGEPVGIIVESEFKTTSFFATSTADGSMVGLDHGHPFLRHVLSH